MREKVNLKSFVMLKISTNCNRKKYLKPVVNK